MNELTPTREDLSDSNNDNSRRSQFSREESADPKQKSATRRVESSYFSPKTYREPSTQFPQSPISESKNQQFTLQTSNRLESNHSERERKDQVKEEKSQPQRSKQNSKYKEQKKHQKYKDQNQELINIKVSPTKNKGSKKHMKNADDTDRSLHAEIWSETANKEILSTNSVFDSDIADEIEYEFDPEYICKLNQRYISPNLGKKQTKDPSLKGSCYSQSPDRSKRNRSHYQYSLNIDSNQDSGDILHQACIQISHVEAAQKKPKQFVKRMQYDVEKRESRDKTIEKLQVNIIRAKASPKLLDSGKSQVIQVSQLSPPQKSSKHLHKSHMHHEDETQFDLNSENLGLTASTQKKLNRKECLELYERQRQFEERKIQAIKMMQEAQIKKQEMELAAKSIGKGKISDYQKQACCDRLAGDADRRKEQLKKKKEQELMKLEQECQEYFKPKINTKYTIKREHVMSASNILSGKTDYQSKMERFQSEAQQRAQMKGNTNAERDL